ncbi:MAG: hypothetical protein ABOK23_02165 [Candidatus Methanoperedens sp.]|nr:hypothetical protein [Candidatus Methanoperedens sp.]MCZ7395356.1 hypothetical protein [Candidatus Methanoperedens sp.]
MRDEAAPVEALGGEGGWGLVRGGAQVGVVLGGMLFLNFYVISENILSIITSMTIFKSIL